MPISKTMDLAALLAETKKLTRQEWNLRDKLLRIVQKRILPEDEVGHCQDALKEAMQYYSQNGKVLITAPVLQKIQAFSRAYFPQEFNSAIGYHMRQAAKQAKIILQPRANQRIAKIHTAEIEKMARTAGPRYLGRFKKNLANLRRRKA